MRCGGELSIAMFACVSSARLAKVAVFSMEEANGIFALAAA